MRRDGMGRDEIGWREWDGMRWGGIELPCKTKGNYRNEERTEDVVYVLYVRARPKKHYLSRWKEIHTSRDASANTIL